jgi:hypothetical protein
MVKHERRTTYPITENYRNIIRLKPSLTKTNHGAKAPTN